MKKAQKFKVGDLVEITGCEDYFFHKGDRAILVEYTSWGAFIADFKNQDNPTVLDDGFWAVGNGHSPKEYTFRLVGGDK